MQGGCTYVEIATKEGTAFISTFDIAYAEDIDDGCLVHFVPFREAYHNDNQPARYIRSVWTAHRVLEAIKDTEAKQGPATNHVSSGSVGFGNCSNLATNWCPFSEDDNSLPKEPTVRVCPRC